MVCTNYQGEIRSRFGTDSTWFLKLQKVILTFSCCLVVVLLQITTVSAGMLVRTLGNFLLHFWAFSVHKQIAWSLGEIPALVLSSYS